jgi:son of sevenless
MSSIINALSSSVVTRLHLTWATCNRRSVLDALLKHNDPSGMFSGYRALQQNAEGPCIPFIGMYLTEILHIKDKFADDSSRDSVISTASSTMGYAGGMESAGRKISFVQRQRWYEVTNSILKFQQRPYVLAESDSTRMFILGNLKNYGFGDRDQEAKFWARSKEMQQRELEHADIRIGLEAAGF